MVLKGSSLTEEHKRKISEAVRGKNNPFYGRKHSFETIEKIKNNELRSEKLRLANIGKKLSNETRQKISKSRIGKYSGSNHPRWKGGNRRYWNNKARMKMKKLGFDLNGKHVHHINKNVEDDNISNLQILDAKEHNRMHGLETKNKPPKIFWFKKKNIPWNKGVKTTYQKRDTNGRFISKSLC